MVLPPIQFSISFPNKTLGKLPLFHTFPAASESLPAPQKPHRILINSSHSHQHGLGITNFITLSPKLAPWNPRQLVSAGQRRLPKTDLQGQRTNVSGNYNRKKGLRRSSWFSAERPLNSPQEPWSTALTVEPSVCFGQLSVVVDLCMV